MKKFLLKKVSLVASLVALLAQLAYAQQGYIYVHKKTLNEENSLDFSFSLNGGPTAVPAFTLNDKPDNLGINEIGADRSGGLWAIVNGQGLYYRAVGSSNWTQKVAGNLQHVDGAAGGTAYYIQGDEPYYFDGTTSTPLGKPDGVNAFDITSNGTTTIVADVNGTVYQLNAGSFTPIPLPTGVLATHIDLDVAGNLYLQERSTSVHPNQISKLTPGGVLTTYPTVGQPAITDVAVSDDGSTLLQSAGPNGEFPRAYHYDGTNWIVEAESRGSYALTGGPGGQIWSVFALTGKPSTIFTRTYTGTGVSSPGSAFWLDDERVRTTVADNSILIPVSAGTYNLAETIPAGWDITNITLYDPTNNSAATVANGTASIDVSAGEVVHVVVENTFFQSTPVATNCGNTFTETFGTGAIGTVGAALTGLTAYHHATSVRQVQDGEYSIVSTSNNTGYNGNVFDHTTGNGTGRMLFVNASYTKDIFYIRRFTGLSIGASYDLSLWAENQNGGIPPNVNIEVYNSANNALLAAVSTGDITTLRQWVNFHLPFTPTTPNIYIVLRNNNVGGDGNDLAIDDISFGLTCDHGDAPDSYGTTNANTGVGHIITPMLTIGSSVDQEPDGLPLATSLGDDQNGTDDEDGVASFPALDVNTTSYDLVVAVHNTIGLDATLSGWIDFNRNGVFDAGERAQISVPNQTTGSVTLHWSGLSGLIAGPTYARLRLAAQASEVISPTGAATSGEVEDYMLTISSVISGTVFNDANGLLDNTVNGSGTSAGGLNAILYDNTTGQVAAIVAVNADGSYSFGATAGDTYTVYISTNSATIGQTAVPVVSLPTGWVSTGDHVGSAAGSDAIPDGVLSLGVVSAAVTNVNFGIEQLPTAGSGVNTVSNGGGTTPVSVPTSTFTNTVSSSDVTPGTVSSIRITGFPTNTTSLTINGTVYTAASPEFSGANPTGVVVPTDGSGNPTVPIAVDPTDDSQSVSIPFVAIDNAGQASGNAGTAVLNFTVLPVSLVSFTAQAQFDRTVLVNWVTSWERDNKYYLVERSKDLKSFEPVGEVTDVAGTSNNLNSYRFVDPSPYQGTSYYRLRQVDKSGVEVVYPWKSVVIRDEVYGVMPNPVVEQHFSVSLDEPQTAKVQLFSLDGHALSLERKVLSTTRLELKAVSALSAGVYVLVVEERGQVRQYRLVMQK